MAMNKKDPTAAPPKGKRRSKSILVFASLGWLVAGALFANKIHATDLTGSLHGALVRSQAERHALSQEIERMSDKMQGLEDKLARYQHRDDQAAVKP